MWCIHVEMNFKRLVINIACLWALMCKQRKRRSYFEQSLKTMKHYPNTRNEYSMNGLDNCENEWVIGATTLFFYENGRWGPLLGRVYK